MEKSRWKWYLAFTGLIIISASMVYTEYLAQQLASGEKSKVELYRRVQESLNDPNNLNKDVSMETELLNSDLLKGIPIIFVDETGRISDGANWGEVKDTNMVFLESQLKRIKASGREPIEGTGYAKYIYYEHTQLLRLLTYFPIVQVFLIIFFVLIGYSAFSSARKNEQNKIWVGMAKETAHQLGTPISAIMAWIEHLKLHSNKDTAEIIHELENDVFRLELIAERFSKIGSTPILTEENLTGILDRNKVYMARRASKRVVFDFPDASGKAFYSKVNGHLLDWVFENLIRNALDSMEGRGTISARIEETTKKLIVHLTDTGKGIPSKNWDMVFQPGFTTKKRGWGLGLSLSRRIIEAYHKGKIYVSHSQADKGTTFTIELPKA